MKRFAITAALAVALAVGFANKADAQVVYGYNTYNPYTGTVVANRTVITPFAAQSGTTYYNPYLGYGGQQFTYQNAWGTQFNRGYGVNPYYGGYNYGYYRPGFGIPYVTGYGYRW